MTIPKVAFMNTIDLKIKVDEGATGHLFELSNALNAAAYEDPGDRAGKMHGVPLIKMAAILFEYMLASDLVASVPMDNKARPLAVARLTHYQGMMATLTRVILENRDTLRTELAFLGHDIHAHPFACILEIIDNTAEHKERESAGPRPTHH